MKIKKISPLYNRVVVTADRYTTDNSTGQIIVKTEGTLKEYQKVVAVGTTVKNIKVGDVVAIDPTRYGIRKHQDGSLKDGVISDNPITQFAFNMIEIDGKQCIMLFDSDLEYIINEYEGY